MREVGVVVWVVFIVIGVIVNIASTARKQAAKNALAEKPQPVRRPQPQAMVQAAPQTLMAGKWPVAAPSPGVAPVKRPQPKAAQVIAPVPAPSSLIHEASPPRPRRFFADGPSLVRAVIAAEVLGKPRALRDE